jgi:hypothetical protein
MKAALCVFAAAAALTGGTCLAWDTANQPSNPPPGGNRTELEHSTVGKSGEVRAHHKPDKTSDADAQGIASPAPTPGEDAASELPFIPAPPLSVRRGVSTLSLSHGLNKSLQNPKSGSFHLTTPQSYHLPAIPPPRSLIVSALPTSQAPRRAASAMHIGGPAGEVLRSAVALDGAAIKHRP